MEYCVAPLVQQIYKPTQLWKGYTKLLVIAYVPLQSKKLIKIMRAL